MQMTLAQFNGFSAAVRRAEKHRFSERAAAVRIGGADGKHYKQFMETIDSDD